MTKAPFGGEIIIASGRNSVYRDEQQAKGECMNKPKLTEKKRATGLGPATCGLGSQRCDDNCTSSVGLLTHEVLAKIPFKQIPLAAQLKTTQVTISRMLNGYGRRGYPRRYQVPVWRPENPKPYIIKQIESLTGYSVRRTQKGTLRWFARDAKGN